MSALSYIQTGSTPVHNKLALPVIDNVKKIYNYFYEPDANISNSKTKAVQKELRDLGFSRFQLDRRESRHIAAYLHENEHIRAAIRGHIYGLGGALIVATDSRILYLHDIPVFSSFEEFAYNTISGASVKRAGRLSSVIFFTNFKTYQIDYINPRQADTFLYFVESQIYKPGLQNAVRVGREVLMP